MTLGGFLWTRLMRILDGGIFRLPPIWRRGRGGVRKWVWGRRWHWVRGIETLGGGRKKDTRKCANPGTQLQCYGKQKSCLSSRWGQNTNANENWRRKTNNYVSEEGRLSFLRNAAQQCSEVLTRRCHNIPKDAQIIREPLLMSNWSVVKEENKWWCRWGILPSYAYVLIIWCHKHEENALVFQMHSPLHE